jgi:hypothetical protein
MQTHKNFTPLDQAVQNLSAPAMTEYGRQMDLQCLRKRRRMNEAFFLPGDRLALKDIVTFAVTFTDETVRDVIVESPEQYDQHQYPCSLCSSTFSSISLWEIHYEANHIFQCHVCHKIMPCIRLLDFHLEELHDSFFAAAVERDLMSYQCLVNTCHRQFSSDRERHLHLVHEHDYPKWFRFHSKRNKWDEKKQKWIENRAHQHVEKERKMELELDSSIEAKKKERRKRQKEKRAGQPCKFYGSNGGCWRGSKCVFLHSTSNGVDGLIEAFSSKAAVSVPDKITFGRRR